MQLMLLLAKNVLEEKRLSLKQVSMENYERKSTFRCKVKFMRISLIYTYIFLDTYKKHDLMVHFNKIRSEMSLSNFFYLNIFR